MYHPTMFASIVRIIILLIFHACCLCPLLLSLYSVQMAVMKVAAVKMVLSSDRPCDIIIMINVDHISIAVRLTMLLMHIVCASTLPLRKRRLSSHWSKPASMARRRTVINSFNVITYRFYFLYLRFAISWLQNYDMLLFREIKPCSTLFQLWKKRSNMQIISCISYSISTRTYHTMCVSPISAMQDTLERNSSGDASLLHRRNSIPEMTVKMHVAEE